MKDLVTGFEYGDGAATNIEIGFVPERFEYFNVTDGTITNIAFPAVKTMAFTSGGTNQIKAGHKIIGATSGATAVVRQVVLTSGSWAGGDAAGTLILEAETETGTFTSESIYYSGSSGTNDATGAATANVGYDVDTEVAADTGISAYVGSSTPGSEASKGVTVAAGVNTSAKLFRWTAHRSA